MASSLTYKVRDDKISFNEFVWRCARQMEPLIHMRDQSIDAKIHFNIQNFDDQTYHQKRVEEYQKELKRLSFIHKTDLIQEWNDEYLKRHQEAIETKKKDATIRKNYTKMLSKVKKWKPPTQNHLHLKELMISQLVESIEQNCRKIQIPRKLSFKKWLNSKIETCNEMIEFHKSKINQSKIENHSSKWILELDKSVPIPEQFKGWS